MDERVISEVIRVGVVVVIALISVVSKLAKSKSGDSPSSESDAARRVREEIRRKIAERRGRAPVAPPASPPMVPQRPFASPTQAPRPVSGDPRLPDIWLERMRRREAEEADRKARLDQLKAETDAQLKLADALVAPAEVTPAIVRAKASAVEASGALPALSAAGLSEELSDPDALRRAFVMNEILSAPLALRPARVSTW